MKPSVLLDHLVSAYQERFGNFESKSLGGLEVDHQLELCGRLNGQLPWFLAPQDAISIGCRALITVIGVASIRQQSAASSEKLEWIGSGKSMLISPRRDLCAMQGCKRIRHHDEAAVRLARLHSNGSLQLSGVANSRYGRLHCQGRSGGVEWT